MAPPDHSGLLEPAARTDAAREWATWWTTLVNCESRRHLDTGDHDISVIHDCFLDYPPSCKPRPWRSLMKAATGQGRSRQPFGWAMQACVRRQENDSELLSANGRSTAVAQKPHRAAPIVIRITQSGARLLPNKAAAPAPAASPVARQPNERVDAKSFRSTAARWTAVCSSLSSREPSTNTTRFRRKDERYNALRQVHGREGHCASVPTLSSSEYFRRRGIAFWSAGRWSLIPLLRLTRRPSGRA